MIKLYRIYSNYADAYNNDPESLDTEIAYDYLTDFVFDNFEPEKGDKVLEILCTVENNQIHEESNLSILETIIG